MNKVVVWSGGDVPGFGRNNTGGYAAAEAERIADGQNPISDADFIRISEFDRGKGFVGVYFDKCKVGFAVGSDHYGGQRGVVVQNNGNFGGVFDNMVIGEDITFGIKNESGTECNVSGGAGTENAVGQRGGTVKHGVSVFRQIGSRCRGNVDYRRRQPFHQVGKRRQRYSLSPGNSGRQQQAQRKQKTDFHVFYS